MKGKLGRERRRKKKKPCLNLKMKMLMWFLFQKHILLIKSKARYWLVGGPAVAGSFLHRARLTATERQRQEAHVVCAGGHGCVHTGSRRAGKFPQSTCSSSREATDPDHMGAELTHLPTA